VEIIYLKDSKGAKKCLHCLFRRDAPPKSLSVRNMQFPLIYSLKIDPGSIQQGSSPSLVCDKGGEPCKLNVGDIAWYPPGTTHWHNADDGSYMMHLAVAHRKVKWYSAVSDEEYSKKQ
jgi:hypothetical protein